jgi:hypothetical protein
VPARENVRRALLSLAQVGGLLATGWAVWFASLVPRLDRQPLAFLLVQAVEYAMMAWAWSAAVTFALFLAVPKSDRAGLSREEIIGITLRTAGAAVWFAPATILLSMFSPAALAAAVVLVVCTTRLLCYHWRPVYAELKLPESILPAATVAACMQGGMVALLMDYPLLGSALFAMSAALLTLLTIFTGASDVARPTSLPRSIMGLALTLILAAGLTVGGLTTTVKYRSRWDHTAQPRPGLIASTRQLLHALMYGEHAEATEDAPDELLTKLYKPAANVELTDNSYPGVVLWPEVKSHTVLVAPMPSSGHASLGLARQNPLSIPFSGEYWMYKPPSLRPPRNSYFRRASPLGISFMTTDHRLLMMEARHQLDRPLDLRCCRAIQLVISNADRYPATVALELLLKDTRPGHSMPLSLGESPVTSVPDLRGDPPVPASETLNFPVPPAPPLREFDQLIIRFHRDPIRIDRSARIAIERFVLTPN